MSFVTPTRLSSLVNHQHPIVFLLEDCPVTALLVERAVMNALPHVRLLWARSVAEATEIGRAHV